MPIEDRIASVRKQAIEYVTHVRDSRSQTPPVPVDITWGPTWADAISRAADLEVYRWAVACFVAGATVGEVIEEATASALRQAMHPTRSTCPITNYYDQQKASHQAQLAETLQRIRPRAEG